MQIARGSCKCKTERETSHILSVGVVALASENISYSIETRLVVRTRDAMQECAVRPICAAASCEEHAAVAILCMHKTE